MNLPEPSVEWRVSAAPVPYLKAVAAMEERVAAIRSGEAKELVWLLEHPPIYTAGTSAQEADLVEPGRFPVYQTGRGGRHTYHGPGQRVGYVLLDLRQRGSDLRAHVHRLEEWVITALADFGVKGERRRGRVGVWVTDRPGDESKIAAIGVRVRHWVTFHGMSLNVSPNLRHYDGIIPCGVREYGVTSLADLGVDASMDEVDSALKRRFAEVFLASVD